MGAGLELRETGVGMGAMVSHKQRDRALGMVQAARSVGGQIVAGGDALESPGAFLQPTVIGGVEPDMAIAQDEVFGPVLAIIKFEHDSDAIDIANSTPYGLVAGVFTRDLDRATRAAQQLRAGQIFVNEWYAGGVETPFGGYGRSGYGREKGREALWNYVQTKNIAVRMRA